MDVDSSVEHYQYQENFACEQCRQRDEEIQHLKAHTEELEKNVLTLRNASETVCDEYWGIQSKYETERRCREEAERYANKMVRENQKVKRQSAMLMSTASEMGLQQNDLQKILVNKIPEDDESQSESDKNMIDHLNSVIEELKQDHAALEVQLIKITQKEEESSHQVKLLKETLNEERRAKKGLEKTVLQLKRLSAMALDEYVDLQDNLQAEMEKLKQTKQDLAHMKKERNVLAHQSAVLVGEISENEGLLRVTMEMEKLKLQLENETSSAEAKIQSLKEELCGLRDSKELINTLQDKVDKLSSELKCLESRAENAEKDVTRWREKVKLLEEKLSKAEAKARAPPPPPMPPPPPPPGGSSTMPRTALSSLVDIVNNKKLGQPKKPGIPLRPRTSSETGNGGVGSEVMEAMMQRIKHGKYTLKRSPRPPTCRMENLQTKDSEDGDGPAIVELNKMLSTLKRGNQRDDSTNGASSKVSQELDQVFKKLAMKTDTVKK